MKSFLFKIVSGSFAYSIMAVDFVANLLKGVLGKVGYSAMKMIDKERCLQVESMQMQMEEQVTEDGTTVLQLQHLELELLSSCHRLRDHASENGGWTREHEIALEAVGNCLIDDMQWEEDDVHRYMKELVESVDGFEYGP